MALPFDEREVGMTREEFVAMALEILNDPTKVADDRMMSGLFVDGARAYGWDCH